MSKHRAKREKKHFLIAGCTLALASIFGLLWLFARHSPDTAPLLASVVSADTPYHSTFTSHPLPVSPDAPPKPSAAELRAEAVAAAQLIAQQQAAAAQAAAAAKAAQEKAAADAAAKAAADKAAAQKAAEAKAAAAAATKPTPAPTPSPTPAPTPAPAPARGTGVAAYQAYAAGKVSASEYNCLVPMWNRESGWNPTAQNPGSTAYGIPQFLDSTWATVGFSKTSDPYTQIDAGIAYVNKAYGGACDAWAFWQAHNYY